MMSSSLKVRLESAICLPEATQLLEQSLKELSRHLFSFGQALEAPYFSAILQTAVIKVDPVSHHVGIFRKHSPRNDWPCRLLDGLQHSLVVEANHLIGHGFAVGPQTTHVDLSQHQPNDLR